MGQKKNALRMHFFFNFEVILWLAVKIKVELELCVFSNIESSFATDKSIPHENNLIRVELILYWSVQVLQYTHMYVS